MSFYLARLEAARQQHRIVAAAGHAHAAPRAWRPYPQHAALLPPLHAGSSRVDTWRGGSVARRERDDGAPLRAADGSLGDGVAAATGATASATVREETGGGELRDKRPLAPTPRPRSPPPKRRAVPAAARRLFPPGCGRHAALRLASACNRDASRSVAARGDAGSGAPHKSALPPPPPALAGTTVDMVLLEAASSPSSAVAASGGSSALEEMSASVGAAGVTTDDGGHHFQGERLVKSAEAADLHDVAGLGSGELLKCQNCLALAPSVRLPPKPTKVSAIRRFPPGCRRLGEPLPAGDGVVYLPEEEVVPAERDDLESVVGPGICTAVSGEGAVVKKKVVHTPRKSVRPPRLIQKSLLDQHSV